MQNEERAAAILNRMIVPPVTSPLRMDVFWFQYWNYFSAPLSVQRGFHRHSFFEAHFPLEGESVYRLESGESITVKTGEYLLLPPGVPHAVESVSKDYRKFSFGFAIENIPKSTLGTEIIRAFGKDAAAVHPQTETMRFIFETALAEIATPTPLTPYRVRDLAFGILNEFLRLNLGWHC